MSKRRKPKYTPRPIVEDCTGNFNPEVARHQELVDHPRTRKVRIVLGTGGERLRKREVSVRLHPRRLRPPMTVWENPTFEPTLLVRKMTPEEIAERDRLAPRSKQTKKAKPSTPIQKDETPDA